MWLFIMFSLQRNRASAKKKSASKQVCSANTVPEGPQKATAKDTGCGFTPDTGWKGESGKSTCDIPMGTFLCFHLWYKTKFKKPEYS